MKPEDLRSPDRAPTQHISWKMLHKIRNQHQ